MQPLSRGTQFGAATNNSGPRHHSNSPNQRRFQSPTARYALSCGLRTIFRMCFASTVRANLASPFRSSRRSESSASTKRRVSRMRTLTIRLHGFETQLRLLPFRFEKAKLVEQTLEGVSFGNRSCTIPNLPFKVGNLFFEHATFAQVIVDAVK